MTKWTKIALLLLGLFLLSTVIHNIIYGLIGKEEPVFFSLSLLSLATFIIWLALNIIIFIKKRLIKQNRLILYKLCNLKINLEVVCF